MRKHLICYLLCFCIFLSGCSNSSSNATGSQEDFLNDMASGISNRLRESQSVDTDSMSQEKRIEYYSKFVSAELNEIEKYCDTVFPESNFNTLAHLYIDACQMQLTATENYKNVELYDALWNGGYQARAGLIVALYEQYDLPITAEQVESYRASYTITSIVTEEESVPKEENNTTYSAEANLKAVEVEDAWYEFYDESRYRIYLKIRNKSGMSLGQVLPSIDIIDENGDIVASTAAGFFQVLDDGQGCTIESDLVTSSEAPYGIRISSMFIEDTSENLEKIVIDPAYVVKNIPSNEQKTSADLTQISTPNTTGQTSDNLTTTSYECDECGRAATKSIIGFSGLTEYYCDVHYEEIQDIIDMMETDVGSGSASQNACEECGKEGTHSIIGISGFTEYYCTEHYNELKELLEAFGLS